MNKKNNCIACRFKQHGVTTRRALVHTCGEYATNLPGVNNEDVIPSSPMIIREDGVQRKEYYLGSECYDDVHGPGVICVMSKSADGTIKVEYIKHTTVKEYTKEVEKIAKRYNIDINKRLTDY